MEQFGDLEIVEVSPETLDESAPVGSEGHVTARSTS